MRYGMQEVFAWGELQEPGYSQQSPEQGILLTILLSDFLKQWLGQTCGNP